MFGVEVDKEALDVLAHMGIPAGTTVQLQPDHQVDIVCAFQILEHITSRRLIADRYIGFGARWQIAIVSPEWW